MAAAQPGIIARPVRVIKLDTGQLGAAPDRKVIAIKPRTQSEHILKAVLQSQMGVGGHRLHLVILKGQRHTAAVITDADPLVHPQTEGAGRGFTLINRAHGALNRILHAHSQGEILQIGARQPGSEDQPHVRAQGGFGEAAGLPRGPIRIARQRNPLDLERGPDSKPVERLVAVAEEQHVPAVGERA
ncbi:MAG: hypothetical protein BWY77_00587 [bacterium ADurb.Bin431]|nr:MAG: hypothetical protein BWY77_00587 [bacterium ADurb.Bin431]